MKTLAGVGTFLVILLYAFSAPRPWFEVKEAMSANIIQAGPIRSVWIATEEEGHSYVHVAFLDGRERKCALSMVGLCKLPRGRHGPAAYVYQVQYPGYDSWKFIAMNVELPDKQYRQLRRAGWPLLGDHFRRPIRIDF